MMFCHQTGGPITGRVYKRAGGLTTGILRYSGKQTKLGRVNE